MGSADLVDADRLVAATVAHVRQSRTALTTAGPGLVGVWLTHRQCAPEHAAAVYHACLTDPRVLPRRHQEDRGFRNGPRGHHQLAAPGAYQGIDAWNGRANWLTFTVPIAVALRPEVLRRNGVNRDTFLRWAQVKSGYAKQATGRQCIVRPDTVASVMGVSKRTVQRCNLAARALGLEVVIVKGRMLTAAEKFAIWYPWRSKQRGLATEVALTIPRAIHSVMRAVVSSVTPGKYHPVSRNSHVEHLNLHGLRPNQKDGAPRRRPQKGCPARWRARQVASDLTCAVPWLAGEGPRRLVPPLTRFVDAETPWRTADLVTVLRRVAVDPASIRTRPAALLAAVLRKVDPVADHPAAGPLIPRAVQACDGPECDGHGWINGSDPATGRAWARKCPDCPPEVRAGMTPEPELDPWNDDVHPF